MKSRILRRILAAACLSLPLHLPTVSWADALVNQLSRSEQLSGWKLLFDGRSADQWRNYKKDSISSGWKISDGVLSREDKSAGDIITRNKYRYFELILEYKISEGGNSGLMFHVTENNSSPWQSGPEVQIQDNVAGHDPQKSGWLYQLYQPSAPKWTKEQGVLDATRPAGEWNQLYLRIAPNQCEVSMNGAVYYQFKMGTKDWDERVTKSKFAKFAEFGKAGEGHICLQDHGNLISFRNIKIRELPAEGAPPQPIDGKLAIKSVPAFPNLKWEGWQPVEEDGTVNKPLRALELTYAKGVNDRLFAIDQRGWVYTFENKPEVELATRFLDIESKVNVWFGPGANEQGLLGLAFHPKFKENGQFFVSYTKRENNHSIVSRFKVSKENPLKADPASEEVLLDVEQPFQNHNGGSMEFGPDGHLYIAFGDGGLRNDPKATGQDRSQLLGSILRIDVDKKTNGLAYGIPADNPFIGVSGIRPEIFAHGFRNPWRIAFDKAGHLWAADVGQDLYEEINIVTKGGNYGWSLREGMHPFGNRNPSSGNSNPVDPVWEYDHIIGKSITGGRVYSSDRLPQLKGKYLYADYVTGSIWALTYDSSTGKVTRNEQVIEKGIPVLAFGEDQNGEVYYMRDTNRPETIFKFVAE